MSTFNMNNQKVGTQINNHGYWEDLCLSYSERNDALLKENASLKEALMQLTHALELALGMPQDEKEIAS